MIRILLDATPLLGTRTGVGRYTGHVLTELALLAAEQDLDLTATAYTWRGREDLPGTLPAGVRAVGPRAPARLLHELWARTEVPRAAWLAGRFDVLHAPNFVLPPTGRAAGVVTVHDLGYLRVPETVSRASARYRELVPRSLRRADLVLTPSRAMADEVIGEYGIEPDRVLPTPLGVDPAWFDAPREHRPAALPDRYLLFVGTVEPRKDLPGLLAAYRLLLDDEATGPDVPPLVLVGPSGWGPALDLAGVPKDRVRSLGYLEEHQLRPVVAGATALCFPSLYEGFGLPPLEALAAGTPVVASGIAAVREVVGALVDLPDPPVRLVPPRDPAALATALRRVLGDPRPDPAPGRAHAGGFTWRATAERTAAAYRQAHTRS